MIFRALGRLLLAGLVPVTAIAQSSPWEPGTPASFGSGAPFSLQYSNNALPRRAVLFSLMGDVAYDDNALSSNENRVSDTVFRFSPRLAFHQRRERSLFTFDYQPDVQLYRHVEGRNTVNHRLGFDLGYRATPRFSLRLRDSVTYRNGIFETRGGDGFRTGLGSPSALNETIVAPLARSIANSVRVDALFQKSPRTSLAVFASHLMRDYTDNEVEGVSLRDTEGASGGLQYLYRVSRHNTFGMLYLLQNLSVGEETRSVIHGAIFTFARQLSPTVSLSVYGGPQYSRVHDQVSFVLPIPILGGEATLSARILRIRWDTGAGFTLTKRSENTVFGLAADRQATDGGGLLGAVISTTGRIWLRRRLGRRWNATWSAHYSLNSSIGSDFFTSEIRGQGAGFVLERSLTERLTARLTYDFLRQRVGGRFPVGTELNRNRVSFGLFYRFGHFAL